MMRPYPFFRFPPFRGPYPYYPSHYVVPPSNEHRNRKPFPNEQRKEKNANGMNEVFPQEEPRPSPNHVEKDEEFHQECFEIFGLKLYFDDLLILALLFFLYQEEVKDTYLYIALLLLLLS